MIITISATEVKLSVDNLATIADVFAKVGDRAHDAGGDQADAGTQEDDHHRFDDGGQAVDQYRDLFFVEVGNLNQHGVDLAGFFADQQHLGDDRREVLAVADRLAERLAVLDFLRRRLSALLR